MILTEQWRSLRPKWIRTYILDFLWNPHGCKNAGKGDIAGYIWPNPKCLKNSLNMLRLGKSLLGSSRLAPQWEVCPSALQLGYAVKEHRFLRNLFLEFCHYLNPGVEIVVGGNDCGILCCREVSWGSSCNHTLFVNSLAEFTLLCTAILSDGVTRLFVLFFT